MKFLSLVGALLGGGVAAPDVLYQGAKEAVARVWRRVKGD